MGGALRIDPFPTLSSSQGHVFAGHGLQGLLLSRWRTWRGCGTGLLSGSIYQWPSLLSTLCMAEGKGEQGGPPPRSEKQLDHPQDLCILEGVPFLG